MSVIVSDVVIYGSANMPEADGVTIGGAIDLTVGNRPRDCYTLFFPALRPTDRRRLRRAVRLSEISAWEFTPASCLAVRR